MFAFSFDVSLINHWLAALERFAAAALPPIAARASSAVEINQRKIGWIVSPGVV
jgi:hypothetical protein